MSTSFEATVACFCKSLHRVAISYDQGEECYLAQFLAAGESEGEGVTAPPDTARICVQLKCLACGSYFPARFVSKSEGWRRETIASFDLLGRLSKDFGLSSRDQDEPDANSLLAEVRTALSASPDEPFLWEWLDYLASTILNNVIDDDARYQLKLEAIENLIRLNPADDLTIFHQADYAGEGSLWAVKAATLSNLERYTDAATAMEEAIKRHPEESFFQEEHEALLSMAEDPEDPW